MARSLARAGAAITIAAFVIGLTHTGRTQGEASAGSVLLMGSSSVNGALGRRFTRILEERNLSVRRRAHSSVGFARPDFFDWDEELRSVSRLDSYNWVFLYIGANDGQPLRLREHERNSPRDRWIAWGEEARWRSTYRTRVVSLLRQLNRDGRGVIVILPVNGGRPGWWRRMQRVRQEQASGAQACGCAQVLDSGSEEFESHDGVHLNARGARRLWQRLEPRLNTILGGVDAAER